jgi:serine/threonine protein kinase
MEYLHNNDISYKDLKASHVFISNNLRIEIIDLGLAEEIPDGE